jgi:hypothetical protein
LAALAEPALAGVAPARAVDFFVVLAFAPDAREGRDRWMVATCAVRIVTAGKAGGGVGCWAGLGHDGRAIESRPPIGPT